MRADLQEIGDRTITPGCNIEIVEMSSAEVIASGLTTELDAELQQRYPGEPVNGIDPSQFQATGGYFVVARAASDYAGCGALRPLDASTVEIKRMFVRPEFRRQGTAWALLRALEAEAKRRGYTRAVLETAIRQPEAIALYRAAGYADIEPFGPYVGSERSVCMGKTL
jgi:GNAT superfamily N-acetyltransferase